MDRLAKLVSHISGGDDTSKVDSLSTNKTSNSIADFGTVKGLSVEELRRKYGKVQADGLKIDGVNHVAYVSSDMARTVWFWSEALGLRLTKTIALKDNGQHFFLDGGRGASLAYFFYPNAAKPHPGISSISVQKMLEEGDATTAIGSVNHTAFNVAEDKLREYRRRIKKTGVWVSRILYHTDEDESGYAPKKDESTTWESFYFCDPDGAYMELTCQTTRPFTPEQDINHQPATSDDLASS